MNGALLEAPPTTDVLVGRLQPGAQLMLHERPLTSPLTFLGRTAAPDGRWYVRFTSDGHNSGSVLRDAHDLVAVLVA